MPPTGGFDVIFKHGGKLYRGKASIKSFQHNTYTVQGVDDPQLQLVLNQEDLSLVEADDNAPDGALPGSSSPNAAVSVTYSVGGESGHKIAEGVLKVCASKAGVFGVFERSSVLQEVQDLGSESEVKLVVDALWSDRSLFLPYGITSLYFTVRGRVIVEKLNEERAVVGDSTVCMGMVADLQDGLRSYMAMLPAKQRKLARVGTWLSLKDSLMPAGGQVERMQFNDLLGKVFTSKGGSVPLLSVAGGDRVTGPLIRQGVLVEAISDKQELVVVASPNVRRIMDEFAVPVTARQKNAAANPTRTTSGVKRKAEAVPVPQGPPTPMTMGEILRDLRSAWPDIAPSELQKLAVEQLNAQKEMCGKDKDIELEQQRERVERVRLEVERQKTQQSEMWARVQSGQVMMIDDIDPKNCKWVPRIGPIDPPKPSVPS